MSQERRDWGREFQRDFQRMADIMAILGGRSTGRRLKSGAYAIVATLPCAGRIYVRSKRGQAGNEASAAVQRHVLEWVERHARRAVVELQKRLGAP